MKKYKVTQEFMDALEDWRFKFVNGEIPVNAMNAETRDNVVEIWRFKGLGNGEFVQRLGALLNWINGEDVFSVDAPSYIVRKKGVRKYVNVEVEGGFELVEDKRYATVFYRLEDAKEYENAIFEVVEVDE